MKTQRMIQLPWNQGLFGMRPMLNFEAVDAPAPNLPKPERIKAKGASPYAQTLVWKATWGPAPLSDRGAQLRAFFWPLREAPAAA